MKFIHCADIHLDSAFTLTNPADAGRRRNELRAAFSSLVLYAKSEDCRLFFISGDLFDDKTVTKDTFEMLEREMSSFPSCRFFISPGNHDPYGDKSPYTYVSFPENVHVFTSESMEYVDLPEMGVRVYGYAFTSDTKKDSPLEGFKVENTELMNILVCHGEVGNPLSNYCPVYEADIAASGLDYVALGHIHKGSGLKYAGNVPYAYPGCVMGRGFDETGNKGAYIGEISKDGVSLKALRLSGRKYEIAKCDITGASSVSDAADRIISACGNYGDDTALRLVLEGITYPEFSYSDSEIRGIVPKPFYLEVRDETLPLYNKDYLKKDNTIIGEFFRNIEPKLVSENLSERETARLALKYGLKALYGREL